MAERKGIEVGKRVEFTAIRLVSGNPVRGKLISSNKDEIVVLLEHDIYWHVNVWYSGEKRSFRRSLIEDLIEITEDKL